jgi:hypothetical protein
MVSHSAHSAAALARLTLLVERLKDAEILLVDEGAELLAEAEAARQSLEAGNPIAGRRHVEQVERVTEALMDSGALDRAEGREVIDAARRILAGQNADPNGGTNG